MLDDGTYDVIVVDAESIDAGSGDARSGDAGSGDARSGDAGSAAAEPAMRLDLTILAGAHKGEVVSMRAAGLGIDEIEALGLPGTLIVREGEPTIALDR